MLPLQVPYSTGRVTLLAWVMLCSRVDFACSWVIPPTDTPPTWTPFMIVWEPPTQAPRPT